jgi:plasmid stabilization system protein ParE
MTVRLATAADQDLDEAFSYYEAIRPGLGVELLHEFRRGIDHILELPGGWQRMDELYRRYRLNRFPYGIVYREDKIGNEIVVVEVMHLKRKPADWRRREP